MLTKLDILDLVGKNPGKLKVIKTIKQDGSIITIYDVNSTQFAVRI